MTHYNRAIKQRAGFSLVELSVVLVILGLLTGGILAGQNLIRGAKLKSITSAKESTKMALDIFRDQYLDLPGDLPDATDYWGAVGGAGAGAACFTADASAGGTCNGNGDGKINYAPGATAGSDVWEWGERFHLWVHLAYAGLIEGKYTGKTDHPSLSFIGKGGVNLRASKFSNGHYDVYSTPNVTSADRFDNFRNVISMTLMTMTGPGVLTPKEIWNIDEKIDDGLPGYGAIGTTKASTSYSPDCSTSDTQSDAKYNLDHSDSDCRILMLLE